MNKIRIGITGQTGFIGIHLFNTLGLYPEKFERIPFHDDFFQNDEELQSFVCSCDVIVHLAAMNRHNDPQVLYNTNITLVTQLIAACETAMVTPRILFSSSIQEEQDNFYGKSKKEGRKLLEQWADKNNAFFMVFIIPNVFGPFGRPFYNSVVATFCHQLAGNEQPHIKIDSELKLIYVGELVCWIIEIIEDVNKKHVINKKVSEITIQHTAEIKVSGLLQLLSKFKTDYFGKGEIPDLDTSFGRNLWNTFLCYIDHDSFFPYNLKLNIDSRGSFVETAKLNSGGQISFSTTNPGITRGNHFHIRKAERFVVIKGKARIELRRIGTDKILSYNLDGNRPCFVDIPIWYTHNITNTGNEVLYTIFWINEHYSEKDPDTFFDKV